MKNKIKPIKAWYRWIEVSDYTLEPRQHGEYSNHQGRIYGKSIRVKITPISKK